MSCWPTPEHEDAALDYVNEHLAAGEEEVHGMALPCWSRPKIMQLGLRQVQLDADGRTVRVGWVPAFTFFGVQRSDGRIAGIINVRHRLNDFLASYGGHIGYGVRQSAKRATPPKCWKQRWATAARSGCTASWFPAIRATAHPPEQYRRTPAIWDGTPCIHMVI